ncbi:Predicted transcriptional regulator [Citrobacter werkmanii]|uniref:Predicted transcriptional regulator n=1 Tax=Citrobacter werkmanii TaxID=67827 RepID=A0A9N8GR40_9ENTR|nr:AlpA family phage regulatory protein [Citrobacter werkmanii]HEA3642925.1 AlpA family phage regulatory protein [Escherichia coli]CAB5528235.1 Predicted transcriptional regulator [Citrobacter werkmanii]CAB5551529.1 Predicted transcriptional regulator [Citrobacter werkmanii]CAB5565846.1 Predicted transcriptional regulator [Citrobacter werkmanii]CAB5584006.1 Predicted transcriptional regulator [Citrobacter werkmanii]
MFLNKNEVAHRIGVCRTNVDYIIKTDPTFPKPVQLTPSRPQWLDTAIDAWALERSNAAQKNSRKGRAA